MKKTYIIPSTLITLVHSHQNILQVSANLKGDVSVSYGGVSEGGMSCDTKSNNYNVWDDDWSE